MASSVAASEESERIRVLVAAVSAVERAGLESLVRATHALELVGSASRAREVIRQTAGLDLDVVLAQLDAHNEDASAWRELGSRPRAPAIVLLVDGPVEAEALAELHAEDSNVRGLLPLTATAAEIIAAIKAAAAGLIVVHPNLVEALLAGAESAPRERPAPLGPPLSPRETEVLNMLAQGLGNKEIAGRLRLSEHTVKFHITSIFNKLSASTRTEAVTLGIRQGLILL